MPSTRTYLALGTAQPDRDNPTSWPQEFNGSEGVSAAGYQRAEITFSDPVTPSETGSYIRNSAPITFPIANNEWPAGSWCSLWDAQSGGHMLAILEFGSPEVPQGNKLSFDTETLEVIIHGNPPPYGPRESMMKHIFMGENYPQPSALFIGQINVLGEEPQGGYSRQAMEGWLLTTSQPDFGAREVNGSSALFGPATQNWGFVRGAGLFNHPTAGIVVWASAPLGATVVHSGAMKPECRTREARAFRRVGTCMPA